MVQFLYTNHYSVPPSCFSLFFFTHQKVLLFDFFPQVGHCEMSHLFLVIPVFWTLACLKVGHCEMSHLHLVPLYFLPLSLFTPQKLLNPLFSIKSPPKESPFLDTKLVQKLLSIGYINVESNQFSLYILLTILSHPRPFPYTFV